MNINKYIKFTVIANIKLNVDSKLTEKGKLKAFKLNQDQLMITEFEKGNNKNIVKINVRLKSIFILRNIINCDIFPSFTLFTNNMVPCFKNVFSESRNSKLR